MDVSAYYWSRSKTLLRGHDVDAASGRPPVVDFRTGAQIAIAFFVCHSALVLAIAPVFVAHMIGWALMPHGFVGFLVGAGLFVALAPRLSSAEFYPDSLLLAAIVYFGSSLLLCFAGVLIYRHFGIV